MQQNTTKQQFMKREGSYSTRSSRTGANLLGWEEEEYLSPEQERDCLVAKVKQFHELFAAMSKSDPRRKPLADSFNRLNFRINELRPKMKTPGIERYVMEVLRQEFSRYEFDRIIKKAKSLRAKEDREALK